MANNNSSSGPSGNKATHLFLSVTRTLSAHIPPPVPQSTLREHFLQLSITTLFMVLGTFSVFATEIAVPNGSFEQPETPFADPRMDAWQKAPEPAWYTGGDEFPWGQLVGQFRNLEPGEPGHIANLDGHQAAFLFAQPGVGIFQDQNMPNVPDVEPRPGVDAHFEIGSSYTLTVALRGGGGEMAEGVTLRILLYYRNDDGDRVEVAATEVAHSATAFPLGNPFVDYQLEVGPVQALDPFVNRPIGIELASTVGFDKAGGYWDIDHVRLRVSSDVLISGVQVEDGTVRFRINAQAGRYEVLYTDDLSGSGDTWTVGGEIEVEGGMDGVEYVDSNPSNAGSRFYRARRVP